MVFSYIGIQTLATVTNAPKDELVVKVQGIQWAWSFQYPNGMTKTELVVPVDQNLTMEMVATDVIHSFWVPQWRVKQDLVPGHVTHVHFTPDKVGEFTLECNQICGLSTRHDSESARRIAGGIHGLDARATGGPGPADGKQINSGEA